MNIQKIRTSQAPNIKELRFSQALNIQEIWKYPGDSCLIGQGSKRAQELKKSPGKFCQRIFCPGTKQGQKSWNFLLWQEKILEFSQKNISRIPGKYGIPGIFWSQNFPILERFVWKFSVPGFCFTENSGIPYQLKCYEPHIGAQTPFCLLVYCQ